jgi:hypothetical protein
VIFDPHLAFRLGACVVAFRKFVVVARVERTLVLHLDFALFVERVDQLRAEIQKYRRLGLRFR